MVSSNFRIIDADIQKEKPHDPTHRNDLYIDNVIDSLMYNIAAYDVTLWNKLYRREVFKDIVFPEGKVYEDTSTVHLLIENAESMAISKKYLYNYYMQLDSVTRGKKLTKTVFEHLYATIERHEEKRNLLYHLKKILHIIEL